MALVVVGLLAATVHLSHIPAAHAHPVPGQVDVGTSFSPRRAEALGLDYREAFKRLEAMHFRVIRLPVYWDQVDQQGYDQTDWMMSEAQASSQPVVLTVGMKSLGWPEFYIPQSRMPVATHDGQDIAQDPGLRAAALEFVRETMTRYRDNRVLVAWQIENEPFNRAGLHRWWIGAEFLRQEIAAARDLDDRPIIVNVFSHFNLQLDQASRRHGFDVRNLVGFDSDSEERESLAALRPGDILGLDVYTRIGYRSLGVDAVGTASRDWADHVTHWDSVARGQQKVSWVSEAQAEPWEASPATLANPKSFGPGDMRNAFAGLKDAGAGTVLLWGSEYWLWRAASGDPRWLDTAATILRSESKAPPLQT